MKQLLFLCLTIFPLLLPAQYTLSGYVRDSASGEALIGAVIAVPEFKTGTYSNNYGFYSLTVRQSKVLVRIDYPGYEGEVRELDLNGDLRLDVNLKEKQFDLDEVVISEQKARENVERATMGVIDMDVQEIELLPFIGGEKDLLKAVQLLPGVQSGSEASAGFYVRGGRPDQNLILMDEATVYNPFHLAGYISIFNTDAIRNVTLHKGSFPAQFGGRLSSILDISMKEGNRKKLHGEGGIGVISSRLTLEGPIIKDKASFLISGRRFYWDLLVQPFLPFGRKFGYNFQDLNVKINYELGEKDRLYISGYYGRDKLFDENVTPLDTSIFRVNWGNTTFTTRWNHIFSPKLFSNASFIYSDYSYELQQINGSTGIRLFSGIRDTQGKLDFDYYPNPRHTIKFGAHYTYHTFTPNSSQISLEDSMDIRGAPRFTHEGALYVNDEIKVNDRWGLNLGLRAPIFNHRDTWYYGLEPRVTAKFQLNENASIKGGYTLMNQYVHLVSSSTISLPFDIWTNSSETVKPQIAHQGAVGYFQNFLNDRYEGSLEVYYKHMYNQIDYREGAQFFFNNDLEQELVFGDGWSYGAEWYLRKRTGRLTGWLGYTLSWTWRQFDELNRGNPFPAKYDRRHDLSLVTVYKFNERWSFSSVFVYGTGHTITSPSGRVFVPAYGWSQDFQWFDDFTGKNNQRLRAYHRFDLGLRYTVEKPKFTYSIHIDIYNAYNRRNPFFVTLQPSFDERANATRFQAQQTSLLPMIPSIAYLFKF